MTTLLCAIRGSVQYEAMMAMRARILWLSLLPLTALAVLLAASSPAVLSLSDRSSQAGTMVLVVNMFVTIGIGIALTGRLNQHSQPGLAELLDTTPTARAARTFGVLAGALAAALLPVIAAVLLFGVWLSIQEGSPAPLGVALLGALVVLLPGAIAMTGFAGLLGLLLPVTLARVLVVASWFWATLLTPGIVPIPSPTGTVLSPLGGYPAAVWLGVRPIYADRQLDGVLSPPPSAGSAPLNLVVVLVFAALCFAASQAVIALRSSGRGRNGANQ